MVAVRYLCVCVRVFFFVFFGFFFFFFFGGGGGDINPRHAVVFHKLFSSRCVFLCSRFFITC